MSIVNFKILLIDANKTIVELQNENDRLHKALMEKDKALFILKDLDQILQIHILQIKSVVQFRQIWDY